MIGMPFNATVFKIMIASPEDVPSERILIREVLYEWNAVNSDLRKIVLFPVAWETHSSPEMGDRPQAIINKRLLKDRDLLVGVFWTRIGTATGEYASGTVEEIEEHIKADKPVMLYFSTAPVLPDSIDQDQYSELKKFKDSCKSRGLYETYSDINEFRIKFYRQLQLKLNSNPEFIKVSGPPFGSESIIDGGTIPIIPKLSREAQVLLREASQDQGGDIMRLQFLGGHLLVQSNGRNFISENTPREHAIWEGAIEELEKKGLIKDRGQKRELFGITREGFEIAELIKL
jgi:hypothetical protein